MRKKQQIFVTKVFAFVGIIGLVIKFAPIASVLIAGYIVIIVLR